MDVSRVEKYQQDTKRFGQPHDFMNYEQRCVCGLRKIDYDCMHDEEQRMNETCPVAKEPRR